MAISLNKILAVAAKSNKYEVVKNLHDAPELVNIVRRTGWSTRLQTFDSKSGKLLCTSHYLDGDNAIVKYNSKGDVYFDYFNKLINGKRHTTEELNVNNLENFILAIRERYKNLTKYEV